VELVKAWLAYLLQWTTYGWYCLEQQMQAPACTPYWTVIMLAFSGTGALIALVFAWKIVSYRRQLAAALRAEQERAKIDHDAIAARRWDADKAYSAELGAAEVERRVREAVDQRHAANKPPSPIIFDK